MASNKKPFVVKYGINVPAATEVSAPYSIVSLSGLSALPGEVISFFDDLSGSGSLSASNISTFGTLVSAQGNVHHDVRDLIQGVAAGVTVKESDGDPNVSGVTTIIVSDGTLTDNGGNTVTIGTGDTFDSTDVRSNSADWTWTANNSATIYDDLSAKGILTAGNSVIAANLSGDVNVTGDLSVVGGLSSQGSRNYFLDRVGIGTTDPDTLLHLQHNDGFKLANTDESVANILKAGTHGFIIQTTGGDTIFALKNSTENVGIGVEYPNEKLSVTGNISAHGTIYDETTNSLQWSSSFTTTNENSSVWTQAYTDFNGNSAQYESVFTNVNLNSGAWQAAAGDSGEENQNAWTTIDINDTDSGFTWGTDDVAADSKTDTFKLVAGLNVELKSDATNDAIRITNTQYLTEVSNNSSQWNSTWTDFNANSAQYESTFTSFNANSSQYDSTWTDFNANSSQYESVFTHTKSLSDTWKKVYSISCADGDNSDEEKIRLSDDSGVTDDVVLEAGTGLSVARSGDKITFTNTVADNNTTYSISCEDGDDESSEKIRLTDNAAGTDDIVIAAGNGMTIARSGDTITLTNAGTNLSEVIATSSQWNSTFTDFNGNSAQYESNWTEFNSNSSQYESVFTSVRSNSAGWETAAGGGGEPNQNAWSTFDVDDADSGFTWGTDDVAADAKQDVIKLVAGLNVELRSDATNDAIRIANTQYLTDIVAVSSQWNSTWTDFNANSAQYESVFSNVNANSAQYESVFSNVNANSGQYESVFTTTNDNSADWTWGAANSATFYEDVTIIGNLSAGPTTGTTGDATFTGVLSAKEGAHMSGLSSWGGEGSSLPNYFQNRIGIGINVPLAPIHIYGSNDFGQIIESTDPYALVSFADDTTTSNTSTYIGAVGKDFTIATEGNERVRIKSDGKVGIGGAGLDTPNEMLTVVGNISSNGTGYFDDVILGSTSLHFKDAEGEVDLVNGPRISVTNTGSLAIQAKANTTDTTPTVVVITSGGSIAAVASGQEATVDPNAISTFTNSVSTMRTVIVSGGTSDQWNSTFSKLNAVSGSYDSTTTNVNTNSADWSYTATNSAISLNTGSHDYLSLSDRTITLGQIDISDDTNLAVGEGLTLTGDTVAITSISATRIKSSYTHSIGDGSDHSLLGATAGVATGSKALIVDSDKDIGTLRNLTTNGQFIAGQMRLTSPSVPVNYTDSGTAGEIAWDDEYIYVCVSTDSWRRAALGIW